MTAKTTKKATSEPTKSEDQPKEKTGDRELIHNLQIAKLELQLVGKYYTDSERKERVDLIKKLNKEILRNS